MNITIATAHNSASDPTPTEQTLLEIWYDLFNTTEIKVDDDFFVLGGHSLLAGRLAARVEQHLGVEISLHQLFDSPTIRELAAYIDELAANAAPRKPSSLVAIQPDGSRQPLYCVHPGLGTVFVYRNLLPYLSPDQPVYGIAAPGFTSDEKLPESFSEMVELYIAAIKAHQPQGPYRLAGYSFGGLIALEMATRLRHVGDEVSLLVVIDAVLGHHPTAPSWANLWGWRFVQFNRRRYMAQDRAAIAFRKLVSRPPRQWLTMLISKGPRLGRNMLRDTMGVPSPLVPPIATDDATVHQKSAKVAAVVDMWGAVNRSPRYPGRILYFYTPFNSTNTWFSQVRAWRIVATGRISAYRVPATHMTIINEPFVQRIGKILEVYLAKLP